MITVVIFAIAAEMSTTPIAHIEAVIAQDTQDTHTHIQHNTHYHNIRQPNITNRVQNHL